MVFLGPLGVSLRLQLQLSSIHYTLEAPLERLQPRRLPPAPAEELKHTPV